jgi:hypothetical protein
MAIISRLNKFDMLTNSTLRNVVRSLSTLFLSFSWFFFLCTKSVKTLQFLSKPQLTPKKIPKNLSFLYAIAKNIETFLVYDQPHSIYQKTGQWQREDVTTYGSFFKKAPNRIWLCSSPFPKDVFLGYYDETSILSRDIALRDKLTSSICIFV